MAEIFRLHLNGGPRDDTYLDHWTDVFEVESIRGGINAMLAAEGVVVTRKGCYRLRIDGNGEPVPHNLEGFVECDWKGWHE